MTDFKQLQEEVEACRRNRDKAEGALALLMEDLKSKHGCDSVEEAEELLEELKVKRDKSKKRYERLVEEFEEKWGEMLDAR